MLWKSMEFASKSCSKNANVSLASCHFSCNNLKMGEVGRVERDVRWWLSLWSLRLCFIISESAVTSLRSIFWGKTELCVATYLPWATFCLSFSGHPLHVPGSALSRLTSSLRVKFIWRGKHWQLMSLLPPFAGLGVSNPFFSSLGSELLFSKGREEVSSLPTPPISVSESMEFWYDFFFLLRIFLDW